MKEQEAWEIDGDIEYWEYLVVSMGSKSFKARFFEHRPAAEAYAETHSKALSESVDKGHEKGVVVVSKILHVTTHECIPADRLRERRG